MKALIYAIVLVSLIQVHSGCSGCRRANLKSDEVKEEQAPRSKTYALSAREILGMTEGFSYQSTINIVLTNGEKREINNEIIKIAGDRDMIHLKKKIDDAHFFEIFKHEDKYFVKNRLGPWRAGSDNKPMYESLIDDAMNAVAWTIEQFALLDNFARHPSSNDQKTILSFEERTISPQAPFVINNLKSIEAFQKIRQSKASGRLEIDPQTKLLDSAHFNIEINADAQRAVKLVADIKLNKSYFDHNLTPPQAVEEEAVLYPVNIAPRFNDLIKHEQGDGK